MVSPLERLPRMRDETYLGFGKLMPWSYCAISTAAMRGKSLRVSCKVHESLVGL